MLGKGLDAAGWDKSLGSALKVGKDRKCSNQNHQGLAQSHLVSFIVVWGFEVTKVSCTVNLDVFSYIQKPKTFGWKIGLVP